MGTDLKPKPTVLTLTVPLVLTDWRSLLPQGSLQATAQGAENLPQRAEGLAQEVLHKVPQERTQSGPRRHSRVEEKKTTKRFLLWHFVRSIKVNSHVIFIITTYQAFFLFCYSSIFLSDSFISSFINISSRRCRRQFLSAAPR